MCFSATASFTAGTALLIVGLGTTRRARRRVDLPFALIPTLFGVQQLIEGALWLTFPDKAPLLNTILTHAYSLFSHVIWPVYVPIAVLLIEPAPWRRKALVAIALAGAAVAFTCCFSLCACRSSRRSLVGTSSTFPRTSISSPQWDCMSWAPESACYSQATGR